MNFISWQGPCTGLELKYCERCGGLWVRLQGESEVYCVKCRRHMAELPRPSAEASTKPRLPRPDRDDIQGQYELESLQAIAEAEVRP